VSAEQLILQLRSARWAAVERGIPSAPMRPPGICLQLGEYFPMPLPTEPISFLFGHAASAARSLRLRLEPVKKLAGNIFTSEAAVRHFME